MTAPEDRLPPFLDAATAITVVSALLYASGCFFYFGYYEYFNVPMSMVDVDVIRILATTWPLVLGLGFYLGTPHPASKASFGISLGNVLMAAILLGMVALPYSMFASVGLMLAAIAVLLLINRKVPLFSYPILTREALTERPAIGASRVGIGIVILITASFFLGQIKAKQRLASKDTLRLLLTVEGGSLPPLPLLLVGHMDGKYFVIDPATWPSANITTVIDDSRVHSAAFVAQTSASMQQLTP